MKYNHVQGCYKIGIFDFLDISLTKIADFLEILQSLPDHKKRGGGAYEWWILKRYHS